MSSSFSVVATPLFRLSVKRLQGHLSSVYSSELSEQTIAQIKTRIKNHLTGNPYIGAVSERLLALGITEYRQWSVDAHNLIFYSIDDNNQQILLLALMDSRQSIEKLLFELMILTP
ncbi:MAG: hypothetical protein B7X54_09090 [Idiomarina sp. 34-48-12]|nr:MAG: hypothetical protein B7X54_09090 [Idiomarina sp. 34-48-12]